MVRQFSPPPAESLTPLERKQIEYIEMKRLSRIIGGGVLLSCILELGFTVLTMLPTLIGYHAWDGILRSAAVQDYLLMLTSVCTLLPGVLFILKRLTPQERNLCQPFGVPCRELPEWPFLTTLCVIFLGLGVCNLGNTVSGLVVEGFKGFGVDVELPDLAVPASAWETVLSFLAVAFIPAMTEEVFLRGAIMQPLRRYGDTFAVLTSAVMFALVHKNFMQAPMALIAGVGLGYAVCVTGSLWPSILIHMANNGVSVLFSLLTERYSEQTLNLMYFGYIAVCSLLALLSLLFLYATRAGRPRRSRPLLTARRGGLFAKFWFGTPAMFLSLLYFAAIFIAMSAVTTVA
ncbi:MAG: CPBP family intramembrane metalloprotease [Oscillospiraceae bacterium]|jgi:membrane protease YdiL (CAAX protease family)|nr:CPBP family intramembrane metalloprotease [Oscillospiraceae bacterium]